MKLLISCAGDLIEDNIDTTFHFSSCFLIFDTSNNSHKVIENRIWNHTGEVIDEINRIVKNEDIKAVITNEIGPQEFKIFKQNRVKIYHSRGRIIHSLSSWKEGKLLEIK
jgi:predicted Fe-Mo cluster-binding NifX family protein